MVHEAVQIINLVVKVVPRFWEISWLRRLAQKTMGIIQGAEDINKGEIEGENGNNLANNAHARLKI